VASIERTAYPRCKRAVPVRDLHEAFRGAGNNGARNRVRPSSLLNIAGKGREGGGSGHSGPATMAGQEAGLWARH